MAIRSHVVASCSRIGFGLNCSLLFVRTSFLFVRRSWQLVLVVAWGILEGGEREEMSKLVETSTQKLNPPRKASHKKIVNSLRHSLNDGVRETFANYKKSKFVETLINI